MASPTQITFGKWITLLRISIGVIYLWFGLLKFFPGVSPAEQLAKDTIDLLFGGLISPEWSILLLAVWETAVGILLIAGVAQRYIIPVVLVHMMLTFSPLVLLPTLSFTAMPFALTLVGQYIIKNLIIISALFLIQAHMKTQAAN